MISFEVNGQLHQHDGAPDMPLLWFIRDEIGLTGTKYGCGMAMCGACTVHLDGRPVRACLLPVSAAAGRKVTTVEALAELDVGKVVQAAWQRHQVPQCGYCQSGQMMSATALLSLKSRPSDADIDAAMSGNICRCGTYQRIRAAIHDAAEVLAR